MAGPELTVFARSYCHLCGDMIEALQPWQERLGFSLRVVDIDTDPGLEARYGELVPVLEGPEGERICHYFLDIEALQRYFGASPNPVKSTP